MHGSASFLVKVRQGQHALGHLPTVPANLRTALGVRWEGLQSLLHASMLHRVKICRKPWTLNSSEAPRMPSLPLPCRGTKPTPFSGELSFAQGQVKWFQDMQAESLQSSTVKSVQSTRSDHCVLFSVYPYPSSEEPTCLSRVSLSIRVGDGSGVRQPRFRLFSLTADRTSAKATCTRHGMSGKQILLHPRHKDEQSRACHMCTGLTLHLPLHL